TSCYRDWSSDVCSSDLGDANVTLLSIMWSYGASYVGKDGKTITINSKETRTAMDFVKRLYIEAMDPEVLAWDDASNNRCLNAGKIGRASCRESAETGEE